MIKHIWSVICERIVVDQTTNLVSYQTCLEGITAAKLPFNLTAFAFGSRWYKDSSDDEKLSFRLTCVTPKGNENLLVQVDDQILSAPSHRTNILLNGLPFEEEGTYYFTLKMKRENKLIKIAEIPFSVSVQSNPKTVNK